MNAIELIKRLQQAEPEAEILITFIEDGCKIVSTDIIDIEEYYNTACGHMVELKTF